MERQIRVGDVVTINDPPALRGFTGEVMRTNGGQKVEIETDAGVRVWLLVCDLTVHE